MANVKDVILAARASMFMCLNNSRHWCYIHKIVQQQEDQADIYYYIGEKYRGKMQVIKAKDIDIETARFKKLVEFILTASNKPNL